MKSENKTNSFKEGLEVLRDHSSSMENDWSKLEQRLELHEHRHRTLLWTKILSGVAAVLLLLLAWWLFQPAAIIQPKQEIVKKKTEDKPVKNQQEDIAAKDNAANVAKTLGRPPMQPSTQQHWQPQPFIQGNQLEKADQPVAYGAILSKEKPPVSMLDSLAAFHSSLNQQNVVVKLDSVKPVPARLKPEKTKVETLLQPKSPKLALSIIYAPALNGVNNFSNAKVGSDVGVLLTVGLTKRWSISTGAIYAKKLYESSFSDYNPPFKPSLGIDPQSVYADCRVLDIPLNINYRLINKGKNSFTVGTGISSYLMLREDYRYVYANDGNNYNNPAYNYSIANQNKHWFGVLNLEAKYQRQINSRFGVGLQPYMKIPIDNIGFAHVKLQSLGMAVNFNWNISRSSAKDK